jgi:hypothetical protein
MPLPTKKNFFKLKEIPLFSEICFHDFLKNDVKSYHHSMEGSQGERQCDRVLKEIFPNIKIIYEVTLKSLPYRRYDIVFKIPKKSGIYFLEFDGEQHFQKNHPFYKKVKGSSNNPSTYQNSRKADCLKTKHVIDRGFLVIRIDHSQDHLIREHLLFAIKWLGEQRRYYRSSPKMYLHIAKHINAT